jgi:Flp pilus assembly protein TadG
MSAEPIARDRGAVTVEAALGLCSLVAVLMLVLAGMGVAIGQIRCTDAAFEAARLAARGEQHRAADVVARTAPSGATLDVTVRDGEVSVAVSARPLGPVLPARWLTARAFAVLEPGVAEEDGPAAP